MAELVPFNTGGTLYFPLIGSATLLWSNAASGSLVGTNLQISVDGATFTTSTNTGTFIGSGLYQWVYTASETTGKQFAVKIAGGSATNVVEPQGFLFRTFGSANAFYPGNVLGTVLSAMTVGTVSAVLTGTVSTVTSPIGTVSTVLVSQSATVVGTPVVNVTQIAGTAATHTLAVNVTAWKGTAAGGTQGSAAITGTPAVNVTAWLGTAAAGTEGTVFARATTLTNIGAISTLASGTFDANVIQWKATAVPGTAGTPQVRVPAIESNRSTLTAVPAADAPPLAQLDWMYNLSRNQADQVTSTALVYNAGNTLIATAIVSDDGGSYRRGSFV